MIAFNEPLPFSEALRRLQERNALPTDLSSAEIRRQWDKAIRDRSIFSARTTKAIILERVKNEVGEMLDGSTNIATARMRLHELYDYLGYSPEEGFAGEEGLIPPAERGSLRDLSSDPRIDLVLTTNMRQAANHGFREQGQSDIALYAYPAYELVRIYPRQTPRGLRRTKHGLVAEPEEGWPARWVKAGGEFFGEGRMIARKDSPVWEALGSSELFDDALDSAVPPFAFNSGFGWEMVERGEAIELGVITEQDEVRPLSGDRARGFNEGVEIANRFSPEFLDALVKGLDVQISEAEVRLGRNSGPQITQIDAEGMWFGDLMLEALGWNEVGPESARKGWETRRGGKSAKQFVGKHGDWQSFGLPHAINLPASRGSHGRTTIAKAMVELAAGFEVTNPVGISNKFDAHVHAHMINHTVSGHKVRPLFLPDAKHAIRHPVEVWQHGTKLTHIGVFKKRGTNKKMFIVVSKQKNDQEASVTTFTPNKIRTLGKSRKGKLLHASY